MACRRSDGWMAGPKSVLLQIILGGILGGWIFRALGIWAGGGIIGSIIVALIATVT